MAGPTTHGLRIRPAAVADVIDVDRDISVLHLATLVYAAVLPAVELWFLILDPTARRYWLVAVLAAAIVVPLHLRVVWLALRGRSPTRVGPTLAVMAVVTLGPGVIIGAAWVKLFAIVGATGLIVLRRQVAMAALAGWIVAGWALAALVAPTRHAPPGLGYVTYLALSIAWRSVALFALVWLVTSYRHLVTARAELRAEAVVRERHRVHTELATAVDVRLARLVALGRGYETVDPDRADGEAGADGVLAQIHLEAAEALGQARQLVAGYRASTRDAELRAAVALLGATGVRAEILADGVDLGAPADTRFSAQLGAAVRQALDHAPHRQVAFRIRPVDGAATVELWAPDAGRSAGGA